MCLLKKWIHISFLIFLNPLSLTAQATPFESFFSLFDFHIGGSLDFAYSQTPLHYLSYDKKRIIMENPLKDYLSSAHRVVSSGIGFGFFGGIGYRFKSYFPAILGIEYQFSRAGTGAFDLTYRNFEGVDSDLSLAVGYYDYRLRLYTKLVPHWHKDLALSFELFMGMAMIVLDELVVGLNNVYKRDSLVTLRYIDGSAIFPLSMYYGFDIGMRISIYILSTTFDLTITPLFVIPRFSLGMAFNYEILCSLGAK